MFELIGELIGDLKYWYADSLEEFWQSEEGEEDFSEFEELALGGQVNE